MQDSQLRIVLDDKVRDDATYTLRNDSGCKAEEQRKMGS